MSTSKINHPCKIEIKICSLTFELSTTLGGIIEEGDESNEDSNEHRNNIDTNGPLNDFKISVEEAIQAFKGKTMISTKNVYIYLEYSPAKLDISIAKCFFYIRYKLYNDSRRQNQQRLSKLPHACNKRFKM